jgi:hypothetical protein
MLVQCFSKRISNRGGNLRQVWDLEMSKMPHEKLQDLVYTVLNVCVQAKVTRKWLETQGELGVAPRLLEASGGATSLKRLPPWTHLPRATEEAAQLRDLGESQPRDHHYHNSLR